MRGGTRRMWSRRLLRFAYFIAPVVTAPYRFFRYMYINERNGTVKLENVFFTVFITFMVSLLFAMFYSMAYDGMSASPSRIKESIAEWKCNPALDEILSKEDGVITNFKLTSHLKQCDKAIEDEKIIAEQKKAIKR